MFKKLFSFNGRIRRLEYGLSYLAYFLIIFIAAFSIGIVRGPGTQEEGPFSILFLVIWLPLIFILLAQGSKRCHDMGKSGWWQIIPFYVFWMLFQDGQHGMNEYGP
ncbi:MAG: DUF805 domain-containing protein, partial [Ferruginibacter sp.]